MHKLLEKTVKARLLLLVIGLALSLLLAISFIYLRGLGGEGTGQSNFRGSKKVTAEEAFAEGEQLRTAGNVEFLREAIKKIEEARQAWKVRGDRRKEADALKNIGEIYYLLDQPQVSLDHYNQAYRINQELNDSRLGGETLNAMGYAYLSLGDKQKALEHCSRALKISQDIVNPREEARALNYIGEIHYGYSKLQQSLEFYQQALSIWCILDDRRGQAQSLLNFGYTYSDMGEPQKTLYYYQQSSAIWSALADNRGQALTLTAIGRLYSRLGESQEALSYFSQAMKLIQILGDRKEEARVLNGIGFVHEHLGEQQRAIEYYKKALSLFRSASYRIGEVATLHEFGRAYYSSGHNREAYDYFDCFLSMSRALDDQRFISYGLTGIGRVIESLGNRAQALEYYKQALPIYQAEADRRGEAFTLNLIGRVHHSQNQWHQTLDSYQRALRLSQKSGNQVQESMTLYNVALANRDMGRSGEAIEKIEEALLIVESLRSKVASNDLRTSYFASIQQFYDLNVDLLMQQPWQGAANNFALALEVSERARARSLLDLLSEACVDIREDGDPMLIQRARALQQEIIARADRKMSLLNAKASSAQVTAIIKEIADLTAERGQVESQIRMSSPRYAALTQPQPLSAKDIQQMLDGDTLLLEYSLGEKRSYVWAVTQNDVKAYELPGRAEIEKAAGEVYKILTPPESAVVQSDSQRKAEFNQKADALSQLILKPVANDLGNKRLVIVADGILQYIPFSVLPKPQTAKLNGQPARDSKTDIAANQVPLIYDHEIVNLPSASTLAVIRRETGGRKPAPKAVAVIADPVFETSDLRLLSVNGRSSLAASNQAASDSLSQARENLTRGGSFKRLYGTLKEAKAIEELTNPAERFIAKDFDADLKRATSAELSQYRIIHFATHGVLDGDNPNLSALVFSLFDKLGKPQNGYLYLHDIYKLNLPAELVVLSACDTALGKEFKGEGLVGLTRGFMYAGAPRVMASLWKVGDEPTAKLMREFYRYHLKDGLPPAAALRQAQIKLYQDSDWNAPYYWGSFVLQGEWK